MYLPVYYILNYLIVLNIKYYIDGNEDEISSNDENAALPFIPVQQVLLKENIGKLKYQY